MALDPAITLRARASSTQNALQALVDEAIGYAKQDGETRWDLTVDMRELVDALLAVSARSGSAFHKTAGFPAERLSLGLAAGPAAELSRSLPGAFALFLPTASLSEVEAIGEAHGAALRTRHDRFLNRFKTNHSARDARSSRIPNRARQSSICAARTLAGAMMGFVPTVDGNLRRS